MNNSVNITLRSPPLLTLFGDLVCVQRKCVHRSAFETCTKNLFSKCIYTKMKKYMVQIGDLLTRLSSSERRS